MHRPGQLRRHAERIRLRLAQARERSVRLALQAGCRFVTPKPAGLFGWVDTGWTRDMLAQRMLGRGLPAAPARCSAYASRQPGTLMRINFSATTQEAAFLAVFESARTDGVDNPAALGAFRSGFHIAARCGMAHLGQKSWPGRKATHDFQAGCAAGCG